MRHCRKGWVVNLQEGIGKGILNTISTLNSSPQ